MSVDFNFICASKLMTSLNQASTSDFWYYNKTSKMVIGIITKEKEKKVKRKNLII